MWNAHALLDPEEVDTQSVLDMEVQWVENLGDNMSLITTRSNFLGIEDNRTIGSFKTCSSKSFIQSRACGAHL